MKHDKKPGIIIFPDHGDNETGKGPEKRILKVAGLKKISVQYEKIED